MGAAQVDLIRARALQRLNYNLGLSHWTTMMCRMFEWSNYVEALALRLKEASAVLGRLGFNSQSLDMSAEQLLRMKIELQERTLNGEDMMHLSNSLC